MVFEVGYEWEEAGVKYRVVSVNEQTNEDGSVSQIVRCELVEE